MNAPHYQDDLATMYHGDALAVLYSVARIEGAA